MAIPPKESLAAPGLLRLLVRVHVLQVWRKILAIRQQSRLLSLIIGLFIVGYWSLSFWLFLKGLRFVATFPGLGGMLTERLLFLLFAFLFILLWFSNLVISYTNLFRSQETLFFLPLPIPACTIFQWKFLESTLLASWAFLFLIAPLLAAYGLTNGVPWHFYLATPALIGLFIVLPAVGGAWCAVNVARYLDRRSFQWLVLGGGLVALAAIALAFKPTPIADDALETRVLDVLDRLLYRTRFAQHPLWPSYWLSTSVVNWSEGALATATFFGLVLLSHALFFGFLAFTKLGNPFYEAHSAVQGRGQKKGRFSWLRANRGEGRPFKYGRGFLETIFGALYWLPADTRALLVKDARMFWRDTTQWGQTLVLFGLLAVYIINLRHFTRQLTNPFWVGLVAHLNLMACALNLATLTTRFVYPQFSLEGKRFWLIGLAPVGLARVIRAKFWLASGASLILTTGLMWVSCSLLKMPWERTLFYLAAIGVMSLTLSAMAMGLGTLYPNLKEDNPSKIVSGFGGTFCLVLSFVYIVGAVILLAAAASWGSVGLSRPFEATASAVGFVAWSLLLGWLPLKFALRKARAFEW